MNDSQAEWGKKYGEKAIGRLKIKKGRKEEKRPGSFCTVVPEHCRGTR